MDIYTENTHEKLKGVMAVYNTAIKFFPFENNTLQPERLPLKKDFYQLSKLLDNHHEINHYCFDDLIPHNALSFKNEDCFVIWSTPAKRMKLLFDDALPIESGCYPIPKLVWKLEGTILNVYAVKDKLLTCDTKLFQAPFLNVSSCGNVCMGTARLKHQYTSYNSIIKFVEEQFFSSLFTHTNSDALIKGNITDMYLDQQTKSSKSFSNALLISSQLTLNNIL